MPDEPPREIEVEILPPGAIPGGRAASGTAAAARAVRIEQPSVSSDALNDPFIALVSRLMDSAFVIPGTKIRFGLDPLIGLWPGIGDGASALTSIVLLLKSARYGVPRIVLARMALNVVLNGTVGALPIVGDAFSFWFKSNDRNYQLLRQHAAAPGHSTRRDWFFVSALVGGTAIILVLTVVGYVAMVATIFKILTAR